MFVFVCAFSVLVLMRSDLASGGCYSVSIGGAWLIVGGGPRFCD